MGFADDLALLSHNHHIRFTAVLRKVVLEKCKSAIDDVERYYG